jgi:hypothetical protein
MNYGDFGMRCASITLRSEFAENAVTDWLATEKEDR